MSDKGDQDTHTEPKHSTNKKHYLKDSAQQIASMAQRHHLDHLLKAANEESEAPLQRLQKRLQKRQELRQKNLEHVVKFAHSVCQNETATQELDQDWLYRFFDFAQDVHNQAMQKLWALVLKKEIINPGTISLKTMKALYDMSPKEAQMVQRAATLSCYFGGDTGRKLLLGYQSQGGFFRLGKRKISAHLNTSSFQLPYSNLLILVELGILHATELESGEIDQSAPLVIQYQDDTLSLQATQKGVRLVYYRFTPVGNELCHLLGNKKNAKYLEQLTDMLHHKFQLTTAPAKTNVDHKV
ncbi:MULTISPECIES: TIGR03899 family protein [unclassified Vibrio]|uniref:TIGR03899 family protein n=1 Tax=Vibrio sp. HB236076 TaxID=3232307 RepID=A0AB39HF89_9VIBR|nr:TIGR03899 family protein [Vibrio sp. HB161653]MDP5255597.1 TIGR03899 family protein [Vibrio sp. HB161653]